MLKQSIHNKNENDIINKFSNNNFDDLIQFDVNLMHERDNRKITHNVNDDEIEKNNEFSLSNFHYRKIVDDSIIEHQTLIR